MLLLFLLSGATALAAVAFLILTWIHRKPEINSWRPTMINPLNWIFMPDLLTETGLKFRKAALYSLALFVGIFMLLFILDGFGLLED